MSQKTKITASLIGAFIIALIHWFAHQIAMRITTLGALQILYVTIAVFISGFLVAYIGMNWGK